MSTSSSTSKKPTHKRASILPSDWRPGARKWVACVVIGSEIYWGDWQEDFGEADSDLRCMVNNLSYELIETVEDEGFYPERAIIMEEKYQHLITKDLICDIINVLCTSWAIDFDFSKSIKGDEYFVYTDLKLSNLVLTKDHKIKYIDPDAYGFIPELDNAHRFIQVHVELMHRVQRYYNKIKNV